MKIGVLCSGGDAPGMNPCLRAIVRAARSYGHDVVGIKHGYQGLFDGPEQGFWEKGRVLDARDVSGLSAKGGAFLNSSRCDRMREPGGVDEIVQALDDFGFGALVCLGGNGTLSGALEISEKWGGQVIGVPCTIDNDLLETDYTIGFSTAVDTAVDAIDKLRDTAGSHDMMFVVEVMGRHCGDLAVYTAIAGGCEVVAVPEKPTDFAAIVQRLNKFRKLGKRSIIMVVAEGDDSLVCEEAKELGVNYLISRLRKEGCPYDMRSVVLGHIQRGGSPVHADRILATELGAEAVKAIVDGDSGKMVGLVSHKVQRANLADAVRERGNTNKDDAVHELLKLLDRMSI